MILLYFAILADIVLIGVGIWFAFAIYTMSERGWETKVALIVVALIVLGVLPIIFLVRRYRKKTPF
ncbi:MAG: hypothetical protein ACTSQF_14405 [Candidatus Heimdallarchaeaceae archaeon]